MRNALIDFALGAVARLHRLLLLLVLWLYARRVPKGHAQDVKIVGEDDFFKTIREWEEIL
jgi:hypothetical protein